MSSVPMKMRRIRVGSLLAGCISCLRCADQRSHMQIESLCVPPHSSPFLPALFYLALQVARFKKIIISILFYSSAKPWQKATDVFHRAVSLHIHLISGAYLRCLSLCSSWPHLFIAATDCDEHWAEDAQTLSYRRL